MIIACDLDGTLTDERGVISPENTKALRWAKEERGALCVLATSRPSRCLDLPAHQRALFDCIITCDGAERAVAGPGPARIYMPLSSGDVQRAVRALEAAQIAGAYAVEFGTGLGYEEAFAGWPATDAGVLARTGPVQDLCGQAPVARVYFRPDAAQGAAAVLAAMAALTAAAGDSITCSIAEQPGSTADLVQLSSRTATKGSAVQAWLAAAAAADRSGQRLVVFGDQLNDLSMLELADDAFAVGDAHPSLLRRYQHLPNEDCSAVGREIVRMLTNEARILR